jgi:hypothetical protein
LEAQRRCFHFGFPLIALRTWPVILGTSMAGRADTPIRLSRLQFPAASTNLHFSRGGKGLGRWHPPTCNGAHTWILNEPRGGIGPLLRPQSFAGNRESSKPKLGHEVFVGESTKRGTYRNSRELTAEL